MRRLRVGLARVNPTVGGIAGNAARVCDWLARTAVVREVIALVDRDEYKRRRSPIGVEITPRAFGRDWRLPIVNRFREP